MTQPRFTLMPGRTIARDGVPLVSLTRSVPWVLSTDHLSATEADAFARSVVVALNSQPALGAPRSPRLDDMVVITAPDADPVTCTLGNFITMNAETIGEGFADIFEAMEQGETFQGGGSVPVFTVSLVPA